MKLKHLLIAALVPLSILSVGMSIYESFKLKELSLIGLIVALYYLVPAVLFTLFYTALESLLAKSKDNFTSLVARVGLSLSLGLLLLTFWIVFDGSPYHYRGLRFSTYWVKEVGRYWLPLIFFAIPVPIILYFLGRERKAPQY